MKVEEQKIEEKQEASDNFLTMFQMTEEQMQLNSCRELFFQNGEASLPQSE